MEYSKKFKEKVKKVYPDNIDIQRYVERGEEMIYNIFGADIRFLEDTGSDESKLNDIIQLLQMWSKEYNNQKGGEL